MVLIFVTSSCVASAQCYPTYSQHCARTYSNSNVGTYVLGDKLVQPFDSCMSTCDTMGGFNLGHFERGCLGRGCANGCGGRGSCFGGCLGGGLLGGLFGHGNVPCAGPDTGYTYTPGFGANGQGLRPNFGFQGGFGQSGYGQGQGQMPSYTYRSPRDFLNPNPPSIGY